MEAVAPLSQKVCLGHDTIIEKKFASVGCPPHHLVFHFLSCEAGGTAGNDKAANFWLAILTFTGDSLDNN